MKRKIVFLTMMVMAMVTVSARPKMYSERRNTDKQILEERVLPMQFEALPGDHKEALDYIYKYIGRRPIPTGNSDYKKLSAEERFFVDTTIVLLENIRG